MTNSMQMTIRDHRGVRLDLNVIADTPAQAKAEAERVTGGKVTVLKWNDPSE